MNPAIQIMLSAAAGYLLGSLSPAFLFGKVLKGVDIREVNFKNAGTRNVKATLGLWPAAATALVDCGKGIAALLLSERVFGLPEALSAIPAAAAIAGHIFPFYLGFKGGKGTATALGIFIYCTVLQIAAGRFSPVTFSALLIVALVVYLGSRTGDVAGMVTFFFMFIATPLELSRSGAPLAEWIGAAALNCGISLFVFASITRTAVRRGIFRLRAPADAPLTARAPLMEIPAPPARGVELKMWRLIARPFALLFIPIDVIWGRSVLLLVIGSVSLIFIFTDIFRFLSKRSLGLFFKTAEAKRFSSMTYFLVSAFISFLVFPSEIPYLALAFTTVGDLFGKLFGIRFGKTFLYKRKTIQGALGFLGGSLMTAYIMSMLLPIPLLFVCLGSVFAALVEVYFDLVDDNFSVSLLSGGLLFALRYFLKI
jgi:glycerol-3-phosphate acyltransferase PlsY